MRRLAWLFSLLVAGIAHAEKAAPELGIKAQ